MTTTAEPELVDVTLPNGNGTLQVPADMADQITFLDFPGRPTNVIAALARVALELPGIGKDSKAAPEQGAYAYRGIEAITREAQRLLGKYGVVFVLHETGFVVEPITVNGKPWTDTYLTAEYDIYGPGGVEDKITIGPIHAIGRDNSDKGANKARTQLFKYALLQTLCIGDAKDDADQGSPEADRSAPMDPGQEERAKFRVERVGKLTPEQRDRFRAFADEKGLPRVTGAWSDEQLEIAISFVDKLEQETAEQVEGLPDPDPAPEPADGALFPDPAALYEAPPDATDDGPSVPESATEAPGGTDGAPEAQEATQGLGFDPADLPTERTAKADLRWVAKASAAMIAECGEAVKALTAAEVYAALEAEDLPTTGSAATHGQRLAMRRIRIAMEAKVDEYLAEGSDG